MNKKTFCAPNMDILMGTLLSSHFTLHAFTYTNDYIGLILVY